MPSLFEKLISVPDRIILELKAIKDEIATAHRAYKADSDEKQSAQVVHILSRSQTEVEEEQRRHREQRGYQNRNLVIAAIGAVTTVLIAVATIFSAGAAMRSTSIAKESAEATLRQNRLEQRAWIAVSVLPVPLDQSVYTKPWTSPLSVLIGSPFSMRVTVKNTGKTPAFHVRTVEMDRGLRVKVGEFPTLDLKYKPEDFHEFGTLTPEGTFFTDKGMTMNKKTADDVAANRYRIIMDGRIEYVDAFGISHWYDFCQFMTPGGAFAQCPHHNTLDESPD